MSPKLILVLIVVHGATLQCSYGGPEVQTKLARAQELLTQLASKSATLNEKVCDVQEEVSDIKCGFDSLKEDVTVLERSRSQIEIPSLEQHNDQAASQFSELQDAIVEKKERINILKEFTHPCGQGSWEQVEFLDFRDPETMCPTSFRQGAYSDRPYTCSILSTLEQVCDTHSIAVNGKQYTRVCGRIRGYQVGFAQGFYPALFSGRSLNEAYLTGVSLTYGDPANHIWSFAMGVDHGSTDPSLDPLRCPCDGGPSPPGFVGEDYFCEAAVEEEETDLNLLFTNPLWDGNNCGENSECCTRLDHPYFVKQLAAPTTEDIDLRLCKSDGEVVSDTSLELIEIYIQ